VIAGMMAGLLLSPRLWLSSRLYPQTPVWSGLHALPHPADYLVYGALILSSFFNAWDNYRSWALYAGNRNDADVYMTDAVALKLPEDLLEYVYEEGPDRNSLNLPTWSMGELNVPAYPEPRIYRNLARSLCPYAAKPSAITLIIQGKIALLHSQSRTTYTCAALAK